MITFCSPPKQRRKTETVTGECEEKSVEFYRNAGIERNVFGTTDRNNEYQYVKEYFNEFPKGKRTVIPKYG